LTEVADASFVSQIVPSLRDHSNDVRFEAVRALGRMGGAEAVKHLIRMVRKDPCDFIRREAVRLLRTAGLGQPGILELALHSLKDCSREVRVQAARLLGNFQDCKSILPLLKAMADPHWSVRESAETALLNFGTDAVDLLIEALKNPSLTMRFRAARLLGDIGDQRAADPLRNAASRRGERRNVRVIIEASIRKLENPD
jgi:HEAT repeat protein